MEYTLFGNSGMRVSTLCLGAMTFPNSLDEGDAARVVDLCLDAGVNFIDTADSYQESEAVLGRLLPPEKREQIYLTSKVYRQFCRNKRVGRNSRVNIINSLERSLRLLNTDYLDLYQLHHPDPETPVEETLRTLDHLVQQGKIRYWGVSNHYAWQMAYMLGLTRERQLEPMICVQSCYSIIDRQIELEITPMLERFNVGLMTYSPLCGGVLTGKYHPEGDQPRGEGRADKAKNFKDRVNDQIVTDIVHELRTIAREQELDMNQLAVAWLQAKPFLSTVILGGSKFEHFTSLLETADHRLPDELVTRIDAISEPRIYTPFMNQPHRAGARVNVSA